MQATGKAEGLEQRTGMTYRIEHKAQTKVLLENPVALH
jgi:hypothetical protein